MGATADDRLLKRRLNELEDSLKKMRREVQKIRASKKQKGRGRKEIERAAERELELNDMLADFDTPEPPPEPETTKHLKCRKTECAGTAKILEVGAFKIAVCETCGARFRVKD